MYQLKNFPFGDSFLKDLGIINPQSTSTYEFSTVRTLTKRFPQLGLAESSSLDTLREEFMDFAYHQVNTPRSRSMKWQIKRGNLGQEHFVGK